VVNEEGVTRAGEDADRYTYFTMKDEYKKYLGMKDEYKKYLGR